MLFNRIEHLAHKLTLSTGWARVFMTMALGVLATFAQAPFHFFPALIIAFSGFIWILDGAVSEHVRRSTLKTAFILGWWFGFGAKRQGFGR